MSSLNIGSLSSKKLDEAYRQLEKAPQKSIQLCDGLLRENPHNHIGWVLKFLAHRRLGDHENALIAAQKAAQYDNNTGAHTEVAKTHYILKNYSEAVESANKAIALDANKTAGRSPYCVAALSCAYSGDLPNAFKYAEQADSAYPGEWDLVYGVPDVCSKKEFQARLADIADSVI